MAESTRKLDWQGTVMSVQPRIRLIRSFDQRQHGYLGFALLVRGQIDGVERDFSLGIGPAAQAKHVSECGDVASGQAEPVPDPRLDPVDFYRVTRLRVSKPPERAVIEAPPWTGIAPPLEVYGRRGHRRLASRTFEEECTRCMWGARMAVEMILDQWNPDRRRHRFETFCYGPKSCSLHRAGPPRKVPGRKGMSWTEQDWVDDDDTRHRGPDD